MRLRIALSGESVTPETLNPFDGVGLLRSEFVLRRIRAEITEPDAAETVARYVAGVADAAAPGPVWYRSSDLWSDEANYLRGADPSISESNPIIGRRGQRRRGPLATEIEVVTRVARSHPNLHWLVPFAALPSEFEEVLSLLSAAGWPNRVGCMLEVPSAILDSSLFASAGATNLLVGLNDLTSLLFGAERNSELHNKLHPTLWRLIDSLHSLPAECEWGIAGSMSPDIIATARVHDVPYAAVHYSELPEVLGIAASSLPDLGLVAEIKGRRKRVKRG